MKSYGETIQMKPLQQYFHMVLFIWYVVLLITFESVDEILWYYYSHNKTSLAEVLHDTFQLLGLNKKKMNVLKVIQVKGLTI